MAEYITKGRPNSILRNVIGWYESSTIVQEETDYMNEFGIGNNHFN